MCPHCHWSFWNPLRFARHATNDKPNGASYEAGNEPITKAQRCSSNLVDEIAMAASVAIALEAWIYDNIT